MTAPDTPAPPRLAAIDVGTNTIRLTVAEVQDDDTYRILDEEREMVRLGEKLDRTGRLSDEAIQRALGALGKMKAIADGFKIRQIRAIATSAVREAANGRQFIREVSRQHKVRIDVISGEEEARLAYLAAMTALPAAHGELVVFDSGGGSTQFTFGRATHVDERFSVDVGAVRIAERFGLAGAVPPAVLADATAALSADLSALRDRATPTAVIAMGGTATNLAAVKHGLARYDADIVNGTVLDLGEIDRQIELYRTTDTEARRGIVGLQPNRADVILAGACIVRTVLAELRHDALTVCDRGLRHGLVAERLATG